MTRLENERVDPVSLTVLERWLEEGERLHQSGKLLEAARYYQRVLAAAPDQPRALHLLGLIEYHGDNTLAAVALMERAAQGDPFNSELFNDLGLAYERANQINDAHRSYARAVELKPEFVDALINLGNATGEQGRSAQARAHYEKALTLDRRDARAHYNLARHLHELGSHDDAWNYYENVVGLQPDFAQAWVNMAALAQSSSRARDVIECYRRALECDPYLLEALQGAAQWHSERNEFEPAFDLLMRMGQALSAQGRSREAREAYERALRCRRDDADALAAIGYCALQQDDVDTASEYARMALRANGDVVQAHFVHGRVLRARGTYTEAEAAFANALAREPTHGESLRALCEMNLWRGDLTAAAEACARGIEAEPRQADWPLQRARILVRAERYEEADQAYTRSIEMNPNLAPAYVERATIRLLHGVLGAGWRDREWRIQARGEGRYLADPRRPGLFLPRPSSWLPKAFRDKRVLLIVDECDATENLFVRFIPLLKARGAWIAVMGANQLKLDMAPLAVIDQVVEAGECPPDTDYTFGLSELPLALDVNKLSDVAAPPLLVPDRERVAMFRQRLRDLCGDKRVLAVTWVKRDAVRTGHAVPVRELAHALNGWAGAVVTLQADVHYSELNWFNAALGQAAADVTPWITSDADALAVLAALDQYVTVEQRWFQLRAGLHRPVHVVIPQPSPWWTLSSGKRSVWWPSAQLYRQSAGGDWRDALNQLRATLESEQARV